MPPDRSQRLGLISFRPKASVAVDFLHIELAHEVDGFLRNHLARHHDRKARRIGNHEVCRDGRAALDPAIDLLAGEASHACSSPRHRRGRSGVRMLPSLVLLRGIVAEGVMEAAEVGKVGHVGDQALDARVKGRVFVAP